MIALGEGSPYGRSRAAWLWPAVVGLGFLAIQVLLAPSSGMYPDTARYAQLAYQYLGVDEATAQRQVAQMWCADRAESAMRWNAAQVTPDPNAVTWTIEQHCLRENAGHFMPTASPRYQAIFSSRPGYPAAVAVLAPIVGVRVAIWAVPVVAVLLAGIGVWWLLRLLGLYPALAAGGQGLLYVLPTGTWGVQALTEGPVLLAVTAAMLGGVLLLRGRNRSGTVLLVTGLLMAALVKYSTAVLAAGGLATAALIGFLIGGSDRRGLRWLGGISVTATAGIAVTANVLGWPSITESLQDAFTGHFAQSDVPDPWARLVAANLGYWERWPILVPSNIALAVGFVVGAWALWRLHRGVALVVMASAFVGVGQTVAHPEVNALDRLYVLAWLAVVVGIPVAAAHIRENSYALDKLARSTDLEQERTPAPLVG